MQEMRFLKLDGTTIDAEVKSTSIIYDGVAAIQVALLDVTERNTAQRRFLESQGRYRRIVENSPDIVYALSMTKGGIYYSPTVQVVLGYSAEHLCKNPFLWAESIHPEDRALVAKALEEFKTGIPFKIEYRVKNSGGDWHWLYDRSIGVREEAGDLIVEGLAMDITERKQAESQIQTLAFSDPLTGLPNRRLLMDRLEQALAAASRHRRQDALLFIDLDDFKTINDTLGHDKGDLLLKQISQRLSSCVREGDTVARLGGDEFVVLLQGLSENAPEAAAQAQVVAQKILGTLAQPYELDCHGHHSSASVGITLFGGSQRETVEEPLKRAELAMYQAKAAGRNTVRFFEPEMYTAVLSRACMEADLRQALAQGQFLLHYQPQGADSVRLSGVEALVRWQHPQRGLVSPAEFIPVAETSGLILPLGQWVLESACKQLAAWASRPQRSHLTMAVNVSAREFRQPDFVEEVLSILQATGARPERLKLERTESVLVENVEDIIAKMGALRARGVGFALDDFGTGYSSLSYLKRLPLDQLKIDKSFVGNILTDRDDAAIAKMVVALAESMGLEVIAEGVETEAQRDFLAKLGCCNYQGYLFSRPLPIEEFEVFAAKFSLGSNS
jgi:diguanylate cyclase (GGDEF)-like protein/PAS domain S-box-containing protein